MTRILWFMVFVLLHNPIATYGVLSDTSVKLEFSLIPDSGHFMVGKTVTVSLAIQNSGTAPIFIEGRGHRQRITIVVTDSDGYPIHLDNESADIINDKSETNFLIPVFPQKAFLQNFSISKIQDKKKCCHGSWPFDFEGIGWRAGEYTLKGVGVVFIRRVKDGPLGRIKFETPPIKIKVIEQ